jgi:hypothetical protein
MDWGTNPRFFFFIVAKFHHFAGEKKDPTTSTKESLEKID